MRSESVQQEWEESGEGVRSHRRQLGFCICELSWSTGSSLYSKESLSQTKSLFQSSRSQILVRSHQTRHEKFLMVASLLLNLSCRCCPDRCSASYFLESAPLRPGNTMSTYRFKSSLRGPLNLAGVRPIASSIASSTQGTS